MRVGGAKMSSMKDGAISIAIMGDYGHDVSYKGDFTPT